MHADRKNAPSVLTLKVGDRVIWHHVISNYGHVERVLCTVLRIGKRVTVQPLNGSRKAVVQLSSLDVRVPAAQGEP